MGEDLPCMQDSWVTVSETMGMIIFILNVLDAPLGTWVGACTNKEGCHMPAVWCGVAQWITASCCVGWIWAILWGFKIWKETPETREHSDESNLAFELIFELTIKPWLASISSKGT